MNCKKQLIAISAGLSILAIGLSGCSSDSASSESKDGKITLSVATFNEFGYENLLKQYEKEHPNITIKHKKAATSNEARDNLNTRLAAGSGLADIEAIEMDWLPELMQYSDQFTDLNNDQVKGRWLDWKVKAATTKDGKLIGYGTDSGPEAICYRSDLFAKAGLPTDRAEVAKLLDGDWNNYFTVGKKFTQATKIPWFDSAGGTYQGMVNHLATPFETKEDKVIPLKDNKEIKAIYDQVLTASVNDNLSAHLEQWSEDWVNAFQKDGFATMLCPAWMLGVIEGNAKGVKGWDIADVYPGGGGNWGGSYLTVPTQSKHQKEAQELAAWLTAPEQQLAAFKAKGTFPSQTKALESEDLKTYKMEFFNNAPVGEIMANRAKAIKVSPHKGPNYFAITTVVGDAITRVDVAKSDNAEDSWKKALSEFDQLGLK